MLLYTSLLRVWVGLEVRLGLSQDQLRVLVTKLPQMLGLDYATEVQPKLDALQQRLGCDDAALSAEVLRKPSATGIEVRGAVKTSRSTAPSMMCSPPPATDEPAANDDDQGKEEAAAAAPPAAAAEDDDEPGVPPFLFEGLLLAAAAYSYWEQGQGGP